MGFMQGEGGCRWARAPSYPQDKQGRVRARGKVGQKGRGHCFFFVGGRLGTCLNWEPNGGSLFSGKKQ